MNCSFCGDSSKSMNISDGVDDSFLNVALKGTSVDIAAFVNGSLKLNVLVPIQYCPVCGSKLANSEIEHE